MTCAEIRAALGAYALGALDPDEAAAVHEHLAEHAECRAAYDEVAGLPALLSLVSSEEAVFGVPEPSETGLRRLLGRIDTERRRDRRRRWVLQGVAAAVLVAAVSGGAWGAGRWLGPDSGGQQQAGPQVTAPPMQWEATDRESNVTAAVTMNPVGWGTMLDLEIQGLTKGQTCSLVVVDQSGVKWGAGSWKVMYNKAARWTGAVGVPAEKIARVEVYLVNPDGYEHRVARLTG